MYPSPPGRGGGFLTLAQGCFDRTLLFLGVSESNLEVNPGSQKLDFRNVKIGTWNCFNWRIATRPVRSLCFCVEGRTGGGDGASESGGGIVR
jgi:hypothetical protein